MQPGHVVSRYVILGKLARGGMAEVWLARQRGPAGFNKTLVLKTISQDMSEDPRFVQMFLDEARLAALLNHPGIVQIFDLDVADGAPFIAMEYLDGRNLAQVLRALKARGEKLDPLMSARIVADVCGAIEYAHTLKDEQGNPLNIIHRDVTPENIFLTYQGQVKVLDFGIAKAAASSHATQPGTIRGKLAYMAPEQILAEKLDRRTDIWALGVNLYVMLTGQLPFAAQSDVEFMGAILQAEPLPPSALELDVSEALDAVVKRAMRKKREDRYESAGQMRAELEAYLREQQPVSAFQIAEVMERLYPVATDSERVRINAIRTANPASADADRTDAEAKPAPQMPEMLDTRAFEGMRIEDKTREVPTGNPDAPGANPSTGPITVPNGSPLAARQDTTTPEAEPVYPVDHAADDKTPIDAAPPSRKTGPIAIFAGAGLLAAAAVAVVMTRPAEAPPAPPPPPVVEKAPEPPPPEPAPAPAPTPPTETAPPAEPKEDEEEAPAPAPADRPLDEAAAKANPNAGAISISANTRAEVYVDGKHVGRAPAMLGGLSAGEHKVRVVSAMGAARESSVPVMPGILTERRIAFGKGRLTVKVSPWADVTIDGKRVGTTPLQPQKLLEGTHEVVLSNKDLGVRKVMSVVIRADSDEELKVRLQN